VARKKSTKAAAPKPDSIFIAPKGGRKINSLNRGGFHIAFRGDPPHEISAEQWQALQRVAPGLFITTGKPKE